MIDVHILPTVNAALNSLASVFLVTGYAFIRRKRIRRHRAMMISAFVTSALFLVSYLTYHFSTRIVTVFHGEGIARGAYLLLLGSHSLLAAALPFLAIITLLRGLRMQEERHRRIARWTFPIWLYVSVTGVLVYVILYHFNS